MFYTAILHIKIFNTKYVGKLWTFVNMELAFF